MNTPVWLAMDCVDALSAEGRKIKDAFLSQQERIRLAAVSGVRRQAQFRAGRLLMRKLLARVHGGDPYADWPLTAAVDAAPTFLGEAFAQRRSAPWHMSISHAGRYVACAVANTRIGLDVEQPSRRRDLLGVAEMICTDEEFSHLSSLEPVARGQYFLALWTLKEAALKRDSGRFDPGALRAMAMSHVRVPAVPEELSVVRPEAPAEPQPAATMVSRASAWTWQSQELTMAVVTGRAVAVPRWALPPPEFMLRNAFPWNVAVPGSGSASMGGNRL